MAWEARTPIETIEKCYGLSEKDATILIRRVVKNSTLGYG